MSLRCSLDGEEVAGVPAELALCPFGVFTSFVAVDGRVLGWRQHVARLAHGAHTLWGHRLDEAHLSRLVHAHLAPLADPAAVRVTLYPEHLSMSSPVDARGCRVLVSSGPGEFPVVPRSDLAVSTVEYERELAQVKSTGIFAQIRLRRAAQLAGFDDALFRRGDEVLEGTTWTVLCWRSGEVAMPGGAVLDSITAHHLARVAEGMGWRFSRRSVRLEELERADLVLAVNARSPTRAIRKIDERSISADVSLLAEIAEAYSSLPRDVVAG